MSEIRGIEDSGVKLSKIAGLKVPIGKKIKINERIPMGISKHKAVGLDISAKNLKTAAKHSSVRITRGTPQLLSRFGYNLVG